MTEAENSVNSTQFHFVDSFLNDATIALSILLEEIAVPTPVQILSLLFLDIGKSQTKGIKPDGSITYYGHDKAGAEIAYQICTRLGIDEFITTDVYFIISNHNALVSPGGPHRVRRLIKQVDEGLITDLLLVHKIDQMAKMKIHAGERISEGQLDNYYYIQKHLDSWLREARERERLKMEVLTCFLSGNDLINDHPSWGMGLPECPEIGKIKRHLVDLQEKEIVKTREQAIREVRGKIILYHLLNNPVGYLEYIRKNKLINNILPEIGALEHLDQSGPFHTEDAYTHTLDVIRALPASSSRELLIASIFHDIGKATTQSFDEVKRVYHFYGHAKESVVLLRKIFIRMKWGSGDFGQSKVIWLVENHIKTQDNWRKKKKVQKSIERLFFRGNDSENIPQDFRKDLLALCLADTLGAKPINDEIRAEKMAHYHYFSRLLFEVEEETASKKR